MQGQVFEPRAREPVKVPVSHVRAPGFNVKGKICTQVPQQCRHREAATTPETEVSLSESPELPSLPAFTFGNVWVLAE